MAERFQIQVDDDGLKRELDALQDRLAKAGIAGDKLGKSAAQATEKLRALNDGIKKRHADKFKQDISGIAEKLEPTNKSIFQMREGFMKVGAVVGSLGLAWKTVSTALDELTERTKKTIESSEGVAAEMHKISGLVRGGIAGWRNAKEAVEDLVKAQERAVAGEEKMRARIEAQQARLAAAGATINQLGDNERRQKVQRELQGIKTVEEATKKFEELKQRYFEAAREEDGGIAAGKIKMQLEELSKKTEELRNKPNVLAKLFDVEALGKKAPATFLEKLVGGAADVVKQKGEKTLQSLTNRALEYRNALLPSDWRQRLDEELRRRRLIVEARREEREEVQQLHALEAKAKQERQESIRQRMAEQAEKRGIAKPEDQANKFLGGLDQRRIRRQALTNERERVEAEATRARRQFAETGAASFDGQHVTDAADIDALARRAQNRGRARIAKGKTTTEETDRATAQVAETVLASQADRGKVDTKTIDNFRKTLELLQKQKAEINETNQQLDGINRILESMNRDDTRTRRAAYGL